MFNLTSKFFLAKKPLSKESSNLNYRWNNFFTWTCNQSEHAIKFLFKQPCSAHAAKYCHDSNHYLHRFLDFVPSVALFDVSCETSSRTDHMPIQEVDGQLGKPQVKTG